MPNRSRTGAQQVRNLLDPPGTSDKIRARARRTVHRDGAMRRRHIVPGSSPQSSPRPASPTTSFIPKQAAQRSPAKSRLCYSVSLSMRPKRTRLPQRMRWRDGRAFAASASISTPSSSAACINPRPRAYHARAQTSVRRTSPAVMCGSPRKLPRCLPPCQLAPVRPS